jgi:hypothetical protein
METGDEYYLIFFIFMVITVGTLYLIIIGNPIGYAFLLCIFAGIWVAKRMDE